MSNNVITSDATEVPQTKKSLFTKERIAVAVAAVSIIAGGVVAVVLASKNDEDDSVEELAAVEETVEA